jgi:putative endonuclease
VPLPFTALLKFIGETFDRSASVPAPPFQTPGETGSYGERVAAAFLRRRGYRILYRNFLTREGEIDLVCRDGEVLAFVEVRSRASVDFGRPAETVTPAKEKALRQAAARYLELLNRPDIFYRFDVVEVMLVTGEVPRCELHQDWFS